MSALPPKADMCSARGHVRFGPIADIGQSGVRPRASCLHSGKRLIDVGNDVVWVLDADRKPDVSLRDAGLELLFWRQLRVRCGRRMDGERAGIANVGDMIEQLQAINEPTASLLPPLSSKPSSAP